MFTDESHKGHVPGPDDHLHLGDFHRGERTFLLYVEQRHAVSVLEQQAPSARVEYVVTVRGLHLLGDLILQVLNHHLHTKQLTHRTFKITSYN